MHHRHSFATVLCLLVLAPGLARAQAGKEIVKRWLATNSGVETLRVEYIQTRKMNTLKAPLRQKGVLWLDHRADRFRWQMGDPPKTIVVREGGELLIVRPGEKKFERRPVGKGSSPGMAALAKGFPRSVEDFERKYRLLKVKARKESHRIVAQPRDPASRGISAFTFVVGSEHYRLQAIEIAFRDGSTQQVSFTKVEAGAELGPGLFNLDLSGYRAVKF